MDAAEFDKFADEYYATHKENIRASGEDPEYFAEYKVRQVATDLAREGAPAPSVIVDLGGGVGASTVFLRKYFPDARLAIADVSTRSLEIAASRGIERLECVHFDGARTPFADGEVDLVFVACVFHHVAHDQHGGLLREARRILSPGGRLFLFEHNPWNPLTTKAVAECPFDENAVLIAGPTMRQRIVEAGFAAPSLAYRVFFPAALKAFRPLEPLLGAVPIGAQYYVSARRA